MSSSHESDFYLWTQEQADLLRRAPTERINLPLDWENLAEEIADLGDSKLDALESHLARVIEHLLKLQYSPAQDPRLGWLETIGTQRRQAKKLLRKNPSLKSKYNLADIYADGRAEAAASLRLYDGIDATVLPVNCPFTIDQVLDETWLPEMAKSA